MPGKDSSGVMTGVILVMVGCILNSFTLELLTREDPGSGSTLTFFQFVFLTLEGIFTNVEWNSSSNNFVKIIKSIRFKPRIVPVGAYVVMVLMHWTMSVINNASLGYQISMPLNMVFRSGSLITTAILGWLLFEKTYSRNKIIGIMIVTAGIFVATLASANTKPTKKGDDDAGVTDWTIGLTMLSAGLAITSFLGLYQTQVFEKYKNIAKQQLPTSSSSPSSPEKNEHAPKKNESTSTTTLSSKPDPNWISRESMFYCHFIGLPFFLFLLPDLVSHINLWNQHDQISTFSLLFAFNQRNVNLYPTTTSDIPPLMTPQNNNAPSNTRLDMKYVDGEISVMWWYLLLNSLTQYVCVRGVFMLLSTGSALTTTLVLTLRKFVSLIISVFYFGNVFTPSHWLGTVLVFGGTLLYSFSK